MALTPDMTKDAWESGHRTGERLGDMDPIVAVILLALIVTAALGGTAYAWSHRGPRR